MVLTLILQRYFIFKYPIIFSEKWHLIKGVIPAADGLKN
jgi:hypothetical protein